MFCSLCFANEHLNNVINKCLHWRVLPSTRSVHNVDDRHEVHTKNEKQKIKIMAAESNRVHRPWYHMTRRWWRAPLMFAFVLLAYMVDFIILLFCRRCWDDECTLCVLFVWMCVRLNRLITRVIIYAAAESSCLLFTHSTWACVCVCVREVV